MNQTAKAAPDAKPNWNIKGELFLNCSCEVFCPCVVSLGKHPPTEGHCHTWMAVAIDEGSYGDEDLSGLNIGLMVEIPGRMAEGNWRVALYIDDRASEAAQAGIGAIFSGAAGGTTGLFTYLVSTIIDVTTAPVEITRQGNRYGLTIDRRIQGEIELLEGANPDEPVMIRNSAYWMGPDIKAARGLRSKLRDHGRVWDFEGKSAEVCAIDWSGPGRR
ncbi:hypothetical protein BV394_02655 [Brevirhabdus pacifica]|uniref:Uncharacterized protein n=1 Tax=Brevirhabdus pacifica TaxID=1267768 RepID=A0A1U7DFN0_9RHOB|nr:DUF1326 domain-containing protein [Brevirhabdus pacifica]APX88766.1 hypothetical protein BV394_02655 [Brevirhabdus pacifica]OWU80020.1 hypothetical protein ATO5_03340 [Loktanella sp. 22II-4b]PJJ86708.1 hypothetical protein CLV77_1263 [Brevirhabdus pacifica]